jgi:FHA domain/Trypsin-like peptidase domain
MIRIVQEFGAHAGRQLPFEKDRVRIGRAPDGDVVFDANVDLDASGRHCEILFVEGAWHVVDTGSRNGTFVNSVRVQRQPLRHNDVIECGRGGPRLRVEIPSGAAAIPSASAPLGNGPFGLSNAAPSVPPPAPPSGASSFGGAAPVAPPPPGPNPFAAGVPVQSPQAFGAKSGTVAMPEMQAPPGGAFAPSAPQPPSSQGSIGNEIAAQLPGDARVGKRTVALMIDQALAAHNERARPNRGLKVMVGFLAALMLVGIGLGAWYVATDDRASNNGSGGNDPSMVGARIATANESNIYLLALRTPDGRVRGFCTGFAVTDSHIATNAHCVRVVTTEAPRGAQLVVLRNKGNGEMIAAQPVYLDARFQSSQMSRGGVGYDVGLVQSSVRLPGWVRLASDGELFALREGDAVFVYGFPGMTMNERSPVATITLGLLNRVTDFFDGVAQPSTAQKLQHSAQTAGGSSGSPMFLPSGSVIGVNAGSLSDDEHQVVIDPSNGQRREVEVNRGSNFKYGMRADLVRQALAAVGARQP